MVARSPSSSVFSVVISSAAARLRLIDRISFSDSIVNRLRVSLICFAFIRRSSVCAAQIVSWLVVQNNVGQQLGPHDYLFVAFVINQAQFSELIHEMSNS